MIDLFAGVGPVCVENVGFRTLKRSSKPKHIKAHVSVLVRTQSSGAFVNQSPLGIIVGQKVVTSKFYLTVLKLSHMR